MKHLTIKFKPTGNEFVLSEDEVIRILKEDKGNYEVVGKSTKKVDEALKAEDKNEEASVFSQVVEEETPIADEDVEEAPTEDKNEEA